VLKITNDGTSLVVVGSGFLSLTPVKVTAQIVVGGLAAMPIPIAATFTTDANGAFTATISMSSLSMVLQTSDQKDAFLKLTQLILWDEPLAPTVGAVVSFGTGNTLTGGDVTLSIGY